MTRRALFLDRDGIINVDKGYVHDAKDFEWMPSIFELARTAIDLDAALIVVTNQSGIARGYYTEEQYQTLTAWMCARFAEEDVPLTDVFHCPHLKGLDGLDHPMRKPNPGMLYAARDTHEIDMQASAMLGDKWTDMEAAFAAGVGHLGLVGQPRDDRPKDTAEPQVQPLTDLTQARAWISSALTP
ncbi:HAD family hydrolase [Pyruvatibacter sp.]|uniref:D-glycero-alpha-D-manno-heptose-1,7-bisphosphate 7-phosphatase n=1 Tax=Pyruvatibacter sp. TaxID=1981328 RepID=UPI0032668C52